MIFSVLDQRDTFSRAGENSCSFEQIEPINLAPSLASCPSCRDVLEPSHWRSPCTVRMSSTKCGDLVQGATFELVVSDRVSVAFVESGLTGLVSFERIHSTPEMLTGYSAARPRVTVTRLDEQRSGVRWRRPPRCDVCRLGVRSGIERVVLDEETWDGSDVFMASSFYGRIIVTQRFVDWTGDLELTNFKFISSLDYSE